MTNFFLYLLQSSIVFSCLYIFYKTIFSRITFHQTNRVVLLVMPIIALLAPLSYLVISEIPETVIQVPTIYDFVSDERDTITTVFENSQEASYSLNDLLIYIYFLGCFLMLFKLTHSIWLVLKLKKQSKSICKDNHQIVYTNQSNIFSFFKWIFLPEQHNDENSHLIIEHEKAHIELKHSIDVFFSEIYIMLFWFNPLVYLHRKSLKSIHEYQADAWVLKRNVKTSDYLQALLLNIQIQSSNNLYNYFNQSVIKKRIDMITKKPTRKVFKLTYSLLIIGTVMLCMAFTKSKTVTKMLDVTVPELSNVTTSVTINEPPSLFPIKDGNKKDITSLYGKPRKHPKIPKKMVHRGIDIKAKIGTPIIATADGVINKASYEGNWGNLIIINHSNGYQTWYAHLNGFNIKEKETVKKGDVIGYVGNTGLSTGPHLHYEVHLNNKHLNPINFITE
ncbi:M23/M56 family metallopeptidase [Aquimarina sp. 2201CG5-10]|uniref:M23/M56 family metallopeptidase n=1 Tax=Aquimarina callyspongiae TaxID=3098150 RepID=UPI002AB417E4|nr:M23/M56 family metallopeptidase [Aquimarina sp. 2201CG5-10]MDY8135960.1 M23/M56 family metallopeptidase [Aquimarina sp. 2201CG5-10]